MNETEQGPAIMPAAGFSAGPSKFTLQRYGPTRATVIAAVAATKPAATATALNGVITNSRSYHEVITWGA